MESRYMVVPYAEVTEQMISCCPNASRETLRHSIAGDDRVILEWIGDNKPECFPAYTEYSHEEIQNYLNRNEEW